jgi:DNA-binding transcriptional MerR regulator
MGGMADGSPKTRGVTSPAMFSVGQVAKDAEVPLSTLRYYERSGLLSPVGRAKNGYRRYAEDAAVRVRFIQRAQELGFSLREIKAILRVSDGRVPTRRELAKMANEKLEAIDSKIEDLRRVKRAITLLLSQGGQLPDKACPILQALGGKPG